MLKNYKKVKTLSFLGMLLWLLPDNRSIEEFLLTTLYKISSIAGNLRKYQTSRTRNELY